MSENKQETIRSAEELEALPVGTVIVSPQYMDAYSRAGFGGSETLRNVATGHRAWPEEIGDDFFPAHVIYRAPWAKP